MKEIEVFLVLKVWKIAEALIKFTTCWNSYHAKVSFDKENHRNESAAALKVFSCSYRNI